VKNSKPQVIDLLIRSTDQSETLGIVGEPHGLPLARSSVPKNPLNQKESEVSPQEHLPLETTENTQIEAVLEGLLDQSHQAKRHKVLIRDIQQEYLKETPRKHSTEIPRKDPENHQKGKTGATHSSLEEPRRIIYTYQRGSYKVWLAV
jgi:hypothetical protein